MIVILEGKIVGSKIQYSEYRRPDHTEIDVSDLIHTNLEDIDG